jgi:hypothetical protein
MKRTFFLIFRACEKRPERPFAPAGTYCFSCLLPYRAASGRSNGGRRWRSDMRRKYLLAVLLAAAALAMYASVFFRFTH